MRGKGVILKEGKAAGVEMAGFRGVSSRLWKKDIEKKGRMMEFSPRINGNLKGGNGTVT